MVSEATRAVRRRRLQGIAEGRVLTGPQTVHIDLANGCNTNCTTCWDHSPLLNTPRPQPWKKAQMEMATFEALTADLASMQSVEAVILSGMGDPFVNPHIYRMIANCKQHGWQVTVLTNALLANATELLDLDVDMMLISVNGVTPTSYTAFHPNLGVGDFEKLCQLLECFAWAGKRFKHVQVINRDTAPELATTVHFAHRYSARSITYKFASLSGGTEACAVTDSQREQLLTEWIPAARTAAQDLGVETNLDVFESQVRTGGLDTAPIAEIGCFMGWSYSRITVDGQILFCCSREVVVGHLDQGLFSKQWYGEQWQRTRQKLMHGDYFASCHQCGKLNQNVKVGQKVREQLGEAIFRARTGQGEI
jgi:MoaA/NifB/PqqE/SkfB family radical SAM enzyme